MLRRRFLALSALLASGSLAAAGRDLWQGLQEGGHVLLIRHAATSPGVGDPPGFRLGACSTQRNLSEQGKRDARALGAAFRKRGIPLGPVLSSRWCRCLDTARLAFGRVEEAPMLDSMFRDSEAEARVKTREVLDRAAAWRGNKANLVLVTHDVNIRALVNEVVAQGEIVVTRPVPDRLELVGRLGARDLGVE
ncbi:histidine phosphatase family protein [Massilia sp.]|uniref:histidine phosphatase family protein n=1 Tax=Massilia sp. TaxID=1882437 RepID=UPI00391CDCA8